MKTLRTPFLPLVLFFFALSVKAQETATINNVKLERLESLSQEQKALLKERREIIKSLRADFKASLTEAQSAILKNDSMEKQERRKAFVASLTEDQRALYCVMREGVHQSRGAYHKSLSKDQKEKIKKRHKHNRGHRDMESIPPPPPPEHPDSIKRGGYRLN